MKLEFSDLYYIPNFKFPNGNTRDKYLLVLTNSDNAQKLLLTLPTKIGRVPSHLEKGQFGCINCDQSHFNCFRFLKNINVTSPPGFSFPLDTYVYGEWIQYWDTKSLKMDYSVEGIDYEYIGKIKADIIKDILRCFVGSVKVKRKYKTMFQEMLGNL